MTDLNFVSGVQALHHPALDPIVLAITALGSTAACMVILPAIYWTVDRRRGWLLALVLLLFMEGNAIMKDFSRDLRPFQRDPSITRIGPAPESHAFPSGHAQAATILYGGLILLRPSIPAGIGWGALVFFIGVSRLYLGVHDGPDVLAGWAVGLLGVAVTGLLFRLERSGPARRDLDGWEFRGGWALLGLGLLAFAPSANALYAAVALTGAAILEGGAGRSMAADVPRRWPSRLARIPAGLIPLLLLLPAYAAAGSEDVGVRAGLIALLSAWIFLGAPVLFRRLGI